MPAIRHPDPQKQRTIDETVGAGQAHVFSWWDDIGDHGRNRLLDQLSKIDFDELDMLYKKYSEGIAPPSREEIGPADTIPVPRSAEQVGAASRAASVGEEAIRAGEVAVFLVAGGQATRLGFDAPKGAFAISPVRKKTLFQLHAEKILALSKKHDAALPFYIMTSETNDFATREFFGSNKYFGLDPADVFFFKQEMTPALDLDGKLILDAKDHIFTNPNGHGGSISSLKSSGALDNLKARGIKHVFYFQVDNALINIADPVFLGRHIERGAEMSAKVTPKSGPEEKVGVLCRVGPKLTVIEYSDLPDELRHARNEDDSLTFSGGNIAIHILDVDFVERINREEHSLPYHIARKSIPCLDDGGELIKPEEKNGLKLEKFVFDALNAARETVVMEVVRAEEFAPVKNADGEDSPASAVAMMQNLYAGWLEAAGAPVPRDTDGAPAGPIEISPLYALDAAELKEKLPHSFEVKFPLYLGPE
jgi:UDP-N-acetylglucosamine/UDP-N-acetylgalactosamine diphosphorylase